MSDENQTAAEELQRKSYGKGIRDGRDGIKWKMDVLQKEIEKLKTGPASMDQCLVFLINRAETALDAAKALVGACDRLDEPQKEDHDVAG